MKKNFVAILLLCFLVNIGTSLAVTFPLYYKTLSEGYEYFDWANKTVPYDTRQNPDLIEDNWGISNITAIIDISNYPNNVTVWREGDNGEYLATFFYGLDLIYWDGKDYYMGVATQTDFNNDGVYESVPGAYLELYKLTSKYDVDTNNRINATTYNSITNGELLVRFEFTYGVLGDVNGPYQDVLVYGTTDSASAPTGGDGKAFLKVVPNVGSMWQIFDQNNITHILDLTGKSYNPNWLDPETDLYLEFSFDTTTNANGFNLYIDSGSAYGTTPEPASIILMGSGLMLIGAVARKKFIKK